MNMDVSSMYKNSQYTLFKELIKDLPEICYYSFDDKTVVRGKEVNSKVTISLRNHEQIQRKCILSSIRDSDESICFPISLLISVYDKTLEETKEIAEDDIIKLPIYFKDGMKINGNQYTFSNLLDPARGWQFDYNKRSKDDGLPVVSFRPERFSTINLEPGAVGSVKKYVVKKRNGKTIHLYTLLRAMSSMTYSEIFSMCDSKTESMNMLLVPTVVDHKELSVQECKKAALELLNADNSKLTNSVIDYNFEKNWMTNRRFYMSDGAFSRLTYLCSFSNRALNTILAKRVELSDGTVIESGTLLTDEILRMVDNDKSIIELFVEDDSKFFRIVSYKVGRQLDINVLANICNMLGCQIDGLNRVTNIDELQNKQACNVYSAFKEYINTAIESLVDSITKCLRDGSFENLRVKKFDYVSKENSWKSKAITIKSSRNSVSSVASEYKVLSSAKDVSILSKEVMDSHINFLDSTVTPESKKAGTSLNLVSTAFADKNGDLCNFFQRVKDGVIQDEVDVLTVTQCFLYKISNIREFNSPDDLVEAKQHNKAIKVKARELDYVVACPASVYSRFSSCSVFINHNDGRRVQVTGNQMLQYVPVLGGVAPQVATGMMSMYDTLCVRVPDIVEKLCVLDSVAFSEDLCNEGIYLDSLKDKGSLRVYYFKSKSDKLTKTVPISTDLFSNRNQMLSSETLNSEYRQELEWFGNEIVIKPIDVTVRNDAKINPLSRIDYGAIDSNSIAEKICEQSLKPGIPLNIVIGTWKGYGYEDGLLLCEDIQNTFCFANICVSNSEVELDNETYVDTEYNDPKNNIYKGLVLKNTKVSVGDPLIAYRRIVKNADGTEDSRLHIKRVAVGHEGFVQSVSVTGDLVEVVVSTVRNTSVGDKYTGLHGNKGTITRILPRKEMPILSDGTVADIVLNVQGVPSRENIGQLFEATMGKTGLFNDGILVASPAGQNDIDLLKSASSTYNFTPCKLIDRINCRVLENDVYWGKMYFVKLEHQVYKKHVEINMSKSLNSRTKQPTKSETSGNGQSISELTQACIVANGGLDTLAFLYSANSDDTRVFNKMTQDIINKGYTDIIGTNRTYGLINAYLLATGYDTTAAMDGNAYTLLTDDRIKEISQEISWKNNTEYVLFSNESAHYDFSKEDSLIESGSRNKSKHPTTTKYSHISAGRVRWVNPAVMHDELIHLLLATYHTSKIGDVETRFMSRHTIKAILNGEYEVVLPLVDSSTGRVSIWIYNAGDYVGDCEVYKGAMAILKIFEMYKRSDNMANYKELIAKLESKESDEGLSVAEKDLYKKLLKRKPCIFNMPEYKDLILNRLLMLPLGLRPHSETAIGTDTMNVIYKSLHKSIERLNNSSLTESRFNVEYTTFYKKLLNYFTSSADDKKDPGKKNVPDLVKDKDAGLRSFLLSKRVQNSGRSTIIGMPELPIDRVALPVKSFYTSWKYVIVHWLSKEGIPEYPYEKDVDTLCNLVDSLAEAKYDEVSNLLGITRDEAKAVYKGVLDLVNRNCVNEACLLVREPAMKRTSCECFIPMVYEELAIGISPLITAPYNADFDGDQMAYFALLNKSVKEECLAKMSPKALLREDREGSNTYGISQDMVLGIYTATLEDVTPETMIKGGLVYFDNIDSLHQALLGGRVLSNSAVGYKHSNGLVYVSTPGRILVNSIIPNGEGFLSNGKLKYDCVLDKGKIGKLIKSYLDAPSDTQIALLNNLKDLGFMLADINNTTLSTQDFIEIYDKLDLSSKKEQLKEKLDELEILKRCGMLKDIVVLIKNELDNYEKEVVSQFKEVCGPESNFSKIFDSGSRGSFRNLSETLGYIGFVVDLKDNMRPNIILSSLFEGLNGNEIFTAGYKVRRDQISTVDKTGDAGELTRLMSIVMGDTIIVSEDCGAEPTPHPVKYNIKSEYMSRLLSNLVGNRLSPESDGYRRYGNKLLTYVDVEQLVDDNVRNVITVDGTVINPEYTLSELTRQLYKGRYANELTSDGTFISDTEYLVDDEYLDLVESLGLTEIPIRTSLSCKEHPGVCSKCYGMGISTKKPLEVGYNVGLISAQTMGEPTSQLSISARHHSATEDTNKTDVVARIKGLINKSRVADESSQSVFAQSDDIETYVEDKERGFVLAILGNKKVTIKPSRLTIGNKCKSTKGQLLVKGLHDFNVLEEYLDFSKIQQLLLEEYYDTYTHNGVVVDAKHYETLVKAQSDFCRVVSSDTPNVKVGLDYCIGDIESLIELGHEIEYKRVLLNIDDMNRCLDVSKGVACKDPYKAMAKGVAEGRVERCRTIHGGIMVGKPLSRTHYKLKKANYINLDNTASYAISNKPDASQVPMSVKPKEIKDVPVGLNLNINETNIFNNQSNDSLVGLRLSETNIFLK